MQRHDVEVIVVTLFLGPALSAVVYFLSIAFIQYGLLGIASLDPRLVVSSVPFGYLIAGPPLIVVAIANVLAARLARSDVLRLLLALPVGALCFAVGLSALTKGETAFAPGAIPITGAVVSLICVALVEAFGTPLRRKT